MRSDGVSLICTCAIRVELTPRVEGDDEFLLSASRPQAGALRYTCREGFGRFRGRDNFYLTRMNPDACPRLPLSVVGFATCWGLLVKAHGGWLSFEFFGGSAWFDASPMYRNNETIDQEWSHGIKPPTLFIERYRLYPAYVRVNAAWIIR